MWYAILPSFGIMVGFLTIPFYLVRMTNNLVLGQASKRTVINSGDAYMYLRDVRVGKKNSPYIFTGLDNIPDDLPTPPPPPEEDELVCYIRKKPASS